MRQMSQHPLSIIGAVCLVFCCPQKSVDAFRGGVLALTTPLWSQLSPSESGSKNALHKLEQENAALVRQLNFVKDWLLSEDRLDREIEYLDALAENDSFLERRRLSVLHRIESEIHSVPAKVIYREPATWSQMMWIDVGDDDNSNLAMRVIQKNSPVLVGNRLVGILEKVERKKALVRLLTDPTLNIAVRVVRGGEKQRNIVEHIDTLIGLLKHDENHARKIKELEIFKEQLDVREKDAFLAKGVLHGFSSPAGRSYTHKLLGEGFNYDFDDVEGDRRDLRTGMAYLGTDQKQVALVGKGDLLETSGLDGIFPEGIHVAYVEKVLPLSEGAVSYTIETRSVIPSLDSLRHVQVIPPIRGNAI